MGVYHLPVLCCVNGYTYTSITWDINKFINNSVYRLLKNLAVPTKNCNKKSNDKRSIGSNMMMNIPVDSSVTPFRIRIDFYSLNVLVQLDNKRNLMIRKKKEETQ